jgi:uncharacterized protein YdaU (DUF1376 family)
MSKERSYDLSWMPLHVADWRASDTVRQLSLAGRAAYMELLMSQWRAEGDGLPLNPDDLRRLVGWTGKGWDAVWTMLEPHFPIGPDLKRRNPRIEAERTQVLRQREGQSRGGHAKAAKQPGKRSPSSQGSVPGVAMEAIREAHHVSAYAATEAVCSSSGAAAVQQCNPNPNPNSTASDEAVRASASPGLSDLFEAPAHRTAYLAFRAVHPNATGLDSTLAMMLDGAGGPGGRPVTMWQMGSAFADAYGNGITVFNAQHFRGFLAKAPRERPSQPTLTLVPKDDPGTVRDATGALIWDTGAPIWDRPTDDEIAARGWSVAS